MFPFALQIIVLLVLIGGAIAYIGNYIGRRIGKRRLTIFNLRPRYTAIVITILSGVLIAICTLGILLAVSQDARTAFLGLENLKKEMAKKSSELEKARVDLADLIRRSGELQNNLRQAKKEVKELQSVKQNLSQRIDAARRGKLLFRVGEVISISLVQGGSDRAKVEAGLKGILTSADSYLRELGIKEDKHLIFMAASDFDNAASTLTANNNIYIVKLLSTGNTLWGEQIPARFDLTLNRLVYHAGENILSREVPAGLTAAEIEQEIMKALKITHQHARSAGLLPDSSGSIGVIPYSQISDLAKKIHEKVLLRVQAAKDTYLVGPLEVKFKVSYQ
jgi:uncharacterized protein (DUF3084 family)